MIITDTVSNLISSIKNGYLSKKHKIQQQNSKQNINILNVFIRHGFIKGYSIISSQKLEIFLSYKDNSAVLKDIRRISKPSRRIYIQNQNLYKKKKEIYIITTSLGVLTDFEAKKLNIGGELICKIF